MTQTRPAPRTAPDGAAACCSGRSCPIDRDTDVFPLYVDPEAAALDADKYEIGASRAAQELNARRRCGSRPSTGRRASTPTRSSAAHGAAASPPSERVSFGTYFNAFPAQLLAPLDDRHRRPADRDRSTGARRRPSPSTARWPTAARSASTPRTDRGRTPSDVRLRRSPLKPFVDGGWYWYDVVAGDEDVVVEVGRVDRRGARRTGPSTAPSTIGITTMNRPDFCAKLLGQLGDDRRARGPTSTRSSSWSRAPRRSPTREFFPGRRAGARRQAAGHRAGQPRRLRRLRPRPARDASARATATYVMMHGRRRRLRARGHHPRGHLRRPRAAARPSSAATCSASTPAPGCTASARSSSRGASGGSRRPAVFSDWDFGARNLRSTRWLHTRIDVDFNGWFMCLIPRQVLDEIGLSLPLFIKWDDSEFGLRAKAAGYPTVTFPGAAVWHVPWTDKNDALDWQSYFHQRNRFVAALLHSPYERGGRMVRESLNHQIKHLVSMQYSTVELRLHGARGRARRPDALHGELPTQAGRGQRVPQAVHRRASCRPTPTPSRRCAATSRRARARTTPRSPAGCRTLVRGRGCAAAPAAARRADVAAAPRGRDPGHGRQVVPPRALRLRGRLDARRHLGRALPARPRAVPRPAQAHRRDPPRASTASGRELAERVPRGAAARSPRRRRGRRPSSPGRDGSAGGDALSTGRPAERPPGTGRGVDPRAARRCRSPAGRDRAARGLPPPLPAAAAGAQHHPGALPGHGAGLALVLPPARDPLLPVLLPVPGDDRARRRAWRTSPSTCSPAW